jgi:ABC-type uncharacterized transport system permease subunit
MNLVLYSLFPALMLLLFGGLISTWVHLVHRPDGAVEAKLLRAGHVALGLFVLWLGLLTAQQKQVPVVSVGQIAAFLAFLIWAGQSFVETRIRQRVLSVLPMGGAVIFILIGIVAGVQPQVVPEAMLNPGVALHVMISLAGLAMLLGSGVFGLGSLVLHRRLAAHRFDEISQHLPSLEEMVRLRRLTLYGGWLLISISLLSAIVWAVVTRPDSPMMSSHMHPMLTLWATVSALSLAERFRWLKRQRLASLAVALSAAVLVLTVVSLIGIFAGAHR